MITDESLPPLRLAYHDYYPFGGDTSDSTADQERLRFTGHERDLNTVNATTLDYMHARYYAGMWGRFLTTDAHAAAPSRPQSWNRYFYAHGNPVSFRDPDGNLEVISYYIGYNDASDKPYNYEVAYANRWSLGRDKFEPKAVAQVDHTFQRETPDINYGTLVMKGVAYVGKATRGVAATDASHLSGVSAFSGPLGKYNLAVFEGKIQDTFASYAVPLGGTPKSEIYLGWMPEISTRWSYSAEQVSRLQAAVDNVLKQYVDANKLTSDEAAKVRAEYDIQRLVDEANAKASGTMSSQYFTTGQGH
jgi:RHS repeat-associated protein